MKTSRVTVQADSFCNVYYSQRYALPKIPFQSNSLALASFEARLGKEYGRCLRVSRQKVSALRLMLFSKVILPFT